MSKQYTYTGLNDGQTYWIRIVVTDNAGNIGKSVADNETGTSVSTPSANTPPYDLTVAYSSKTTRTITVTAMAFDKEDGVAGKKLTYKLQTSTNGSSWTERDTEQGMSEHQITLTAQGLAEYTGYFWKVIVVDTRRFMDRINSTRKRIHEV